jgi:hypothetical protein
VLGIWIFDISAAEQILRDHPREPAGLSVAAWARSCGLNRGLGGGVPLVGPGASLDPD